MFIFFIILTCRLAVCVPLAHKYQYRNCLNIIRCSYSVKKPRQLSSAEAVEFFELVAIVLVPSSIKQTAKDRQSSVHTTLFQ